MQGALYITNMKLKNVNSSGPWGTEGGWTEVWLDENLLMMISSVDFSLTVNFEQISQKLCGPLGTEMGVAGTKVC